MPQKLNNMNAATREVDSEIILFTDRTALKHLRDLHIAESKLKHPDLPYHTAPMFSASTTNGLTKAIKHFLKLKSIHCERTPVEGRVIDNRETFVDTVGLSRTIGSIKRIRSSAMRGSSDLKIILPGGRFCACEIKLAKTHDKLSQTQQAYRAKIEASGGLYIVAESLAGFFNYYYSNFESWPGEK
jgi:hypothetical protein